MTRPDYRGMLTDDDVARLVEAVKNHRCEFSDEERQIIRDMATGGRLFKKGIIYFLVGLALLAIMGKAALIKVATVLGFIK